MDNSIVNFVVVKCIGLLKVFCGFIWGGMYFRNKDVLIRFRIFQMYRGRGQVKCVGGRYKFREEGVIVGNFSFLKYDIKFLFFKLL